MAWQAPSAPKHTDLGEIPGLRVLTDEQRETLEKSDPNNGLHSIQKNLKRRETAIAEQLIADYGQLAMDIGNFIDEWVEDADSDSVGFNVMSPTLNEDIRDRLLDRGESYNLTDVYDIACKRELLPMMFYFGVNIDIKTNDPYVVVTRCDYWDQFKQVDDSGISDYVVPSMLINPNDSTYDIDGMTPSEIRRELAKHGFIEKHEVAGL